MALCSQVPSFLLDQDGQATILTIRDSNPKDIYTIIGEHNHTHLLSLKLYIYLITLTEIIVTSSTGLSFAFLSTFSIL